ncbi:MAG TPA: type II toxin-antitoxin system PemK/MazF family toxin [Candidatus Kapabacteria bacterium]|nr:type II toxin-antitoxin system PemK/MazF family toxin [Candidatus Kapabacteria bacterium]
MTKSGQNYKFGDVILVEVPFTDTSETKLRPALVLFEKYNNVVISGITRNIDMEGIVLTKEDGVAFNSVIKMNYIFTIYKKNIKTILTHISLEKKQEVCELLKNYLNC